MTKIKTKTSTRITRLVQSVCLSVCLSVRPSVRLSVCLSVCVSVSAICDVPAVQLVKCVTAAVSHVRVSHLIQTPRHTSSTTTTNSTVQCLTPPFTFADICQRQMSSIEMFVVDLSIKIRRACTC